MLFERFSVNIKRLGETQKLSDEKIKRFSLAKDQFADLLEAQTAGPDPVKNIYQLHDQLTAECLKNYHVVCGDKCGTCCRQMVSCTTIEMQLIHRYLLGLPKPHRRNITVKATKEALAFYLENRSVIESANHWEKIGDSLMLAHRGKRCIYLTPFNRCSIYPVRPIDCRSARSEKKCSEASGKNELEAIRFFFDQAASSLIMDEEERINGALQVIPLIHWPLNDKFRF